MLWYKAWLETRARFLICFVGMVALCGWNVYRMEDIATSVNLAYYYSVLHGGHTQLAMMWLLAVNFTTMGGLLREKAVGAASFTLALPVSRARMMGVRVAVSLVQSAALIVIPWIVMFAIGSLFGKTHSVSQALYHVVLLAGGGVLYYAIALLASSVVEGEYTAPIVSFGIVVVLASVLDGPVYRRYSPLYLMMGGSHYDAHAGLLIGPVPWIQIGIYGLLAACLVLASVKAMQLREF
jgi:hypothetical protein